MLHTNPKEVYKFYHDDSKLGRPEKDGMMGITTTLKVSFFCLFISHIFTSVFMSYL